MGRVLVGSVMFILENWSSLVNFVLKLKIIFFSNQMFMYIGDHYIVTVAPHGAMCREMAPYVTTCRTV